MVPEGHCGASSVHGLVVLDYVLPAGCPEGMSVSSGIGAT